MLLAPIHVSWESKVLCNNYSRYLSLIPNPCILETRYTELLEQRTVIPVSEATGDIGAITVTSY